MSKPMHPAKLYIAKAVRARGGGWLAQWAAPGQIPRFVLKGDLPEEFKSAADAEAAAAICLVDALNSRPRGTWKMDREFMGGAELSRRCGEVGIGPADFALIFGSRHDRVLDMFSGSREPPFAVWWALELFKDEKALATARLLSAVRTHNHGGNNVD